MNWEVTKGRFFFKRKSFESLKRIYVVYTNNQSVFISTGIRK